MKNILGTEVSVPSFPPSRKFHLAHARLGLGGRPDPPARSAPRRDLRSSLDGGNTVSHPPADSYRLSWTARFLVRAALVLRSTSRRQRLDVCFCWERAGLNSASVVVIDRLHYSGLLDEARSDLSRAVRSGRVRRPAGLLRAVGSPRPPNIQRPRSRIGCHRYTRNLGGPDLAM